MQQLIASSSDNSPARGVTPDERAEMEFAIFALQAGLVEVAPSTDGVYPFTLKTTYSSGSEATDN